MTIEFQFTLDDYRNAFRGHYRKGASAVMRWTLRLCLVVGILFLLVGILFVITGQRAPNVATPPFLFGAFWTWMGLGGTYQFSAKRQFAKNPALRQPRRIELSDDGVKTDAGITSSQASWQAYLRYVEAKECFLLYTSPACFSIIPKRVLQPAELDDLRQLLKMNVGKTAAVAVS
jgi:YcxB-like protein